MASLSRRYIVVAAVLPLLLLAMSGLSRANDIFVNTTDGDSDAAPLCTLPDAVAAHNAKTAINGCAAGSGDDTIFFAVTGTITIDEPLDITNGALDIQGPLFGCSGAGPCGITISGGGSTQIIVADPGTFVFLNSLTLANGFATTIAIDTGGGAISAHGARLNVTDCLLRNNTAASDAGLIGGEGGAIYAGAASIISIVNSTFANNTAEHGSVVPSEGGAISNDIGMQITNCTFSGNSADMGGAFFNSGLLSVKSTLFASNPAENCANTGIVTDVGFNISNDLSCFTTPGHDFGNPMLDPAGLANNGGPTDTIALEPGSPAIDHIPVASCTDQTLPTPQPLGTDQRLFPRPDFLNLTACDSGAFEFDAVPPISLVPKSEKIQIVHSSSANSDQVNMGFTFVYNGDPDCDLGPGGDEDALNSGFAANLVEGTCASIPNSGLDLVLFPFVVRTVNHQSYGTLFELQPNPFLQQPNEQVSARLVALGAPHFGVCGEWTANIEVSGLNLSTLGLAGTNPFALLISDGTDAEGCFDITDAIVGAKIPPPPGGGTRRVRRGVRR